MWKLAGLGAALVAAGAVKFTSVLSEAGRQATLLDYLALRCGAEAGLAGPGVETGHLFSAAALHCWGCYAMVAGAVILAFALWRKTSPVLKPLRQK